MNFPGTHAAWMWAYFGIGGSFGTVFFLLAARRMRLRMNESSRPGRTPLRLRLLGLCSLYASAFSACGIAGPPGGLLGSDPQRGIAAGAAAAAMAFGALGWFLFYLSERRSAPR